ncbi:hypothetical protein ES707_08738 [subsurface metagenome]
MKHNPNECANCGADQRPGSILCDDCITTYGEGIGTLPEGYKFSVSCFKLGRKVMEIDVAGCLISNLIGLIKYHLFELGHTIRLKRVKLDK